MDSLLDISTDQYVNDPAELALAERLARVFRYWMHTYRAAPEKLQFLHRAPTGPVVTDGSSGTVMGIWHSILVFERCP